MIELLGDKNILIKSIVGQGTTISFLINDLYSPSPFSFDHGGSTREFATDTINSKMYFQLDKRESFNSLICTRNLIPEAGKKRVSCKSPSIIANIPKSKTFIMLDDTPLNLVMLKWGISQMKTNPSLKDFTDPEDLVSFLKTSDFTSQIPVFFIDIELSSHLTGFEVAKIIREKFPKENKGESFLFSYSSHGSEVINAQSEDFDGSLAKPFKETQIKELFERFNL